MFSLAGKLTRENHGFTNQNTEITEFPVTLNEVELSPCIGVVLSQEGISFLYGLHFM